MAAADAAQALAANPLPVLGGTGGLLGLCALLLHKLSAAHDRADSVSARSVRLLEDELVAMRADRDIARAEAAELRERLHQAEIRAARAEGTHP